ncbi:MAG: DUF11 domain-containing protein, partial [Holophagales bacterium]|nr:DUF11 domain-containing protein [Holophagales bacterium]
GVSEITNTVSIADDGANGADPTPANNTDTEPTPVAAAPDLAVSKTDGGAGAVPGGAVTYAISYANNGDQGATGVVLTETAPTHTTSGVNPGWEVGSVGSGVPCNAQPAGTTCVLGLGALAAGGSGSASFVVAVDDPLPAGVTEVLNTVSIADDGANGADPTPGDNTSSDTTPVSAAPDLVVTKDDGGATASAGSTITFTLTYGNVGDQGATGVVLSETVPAHTTSAANAGWDVAPVGSGTPCAGQAPGTVCVLAVGAVPVGGGGSASFAVTVDDPLAAGVSEVQNAVTIADDGSNGPDQDPGNNDDQDQTPVDAAPDLAVTKDDGGQTATPGDTISYTIAYENLGSQDATGVVLTETVPAHSSSGVNPGWELGPVGSGVACDSQPAGSLCVFAVGGLAAGGSGVASFEVVVDDPLAAGVTSIDNTVTIADDGANGPDEDPSNNDDQDQTPVDAVPDLALVKDDGGQTAMPGDTVTYLLTYSNVGDQGATGVVITETVPTHTTSAANPGWEVTPVGSGIPCDARPAGTVCELAVGAVAGGEGGSATFAVTIDDPLPDGVEQVTNSATIGDDGANGDDPDPSNNEDQDQTPVGAAPDLTISKDDGGVIAMPGSAITYTLSYSNVGNQEATGVVITETVPLATTSGSNPGWEVAPVGSGVPCDAQPAGTSCVLALGALAGGDSATATFVVTVDSPKPAGVEVILNTVTIADDGTNGPDPTPENNLDTEPTPAQAGPDLAISKDDGGVTAMPGDTVVYTLDYANLGDQDASGVFLTETVPVHTTSGSNPGWEVAPAGSGTPCDSQPAGTACVLAIGDLGAGESGQASFAVVIDNPLAAGVMEVTNTAVIDDDGSSGPDLDPDNNDSTDPTDIVGTPGLDVLKVAEPPDGEGYRTGDIFEWTVTLVNTGDQDIADLELVDVLPPEVIYVPETMLLDDAPLTDAAGDDAGEFDGSVTLTVRIALVAVGETVTFRFFTEVSGEDPEEDGLVFNQALVTDPDGDTTPSDDPGTLDPDDPTQVPIILDTIVEIPTAGAWGLGLLAALLALVASLHIASRRQRNRVAHPGS